MRAAKYRFVLGVGRSGTTLLGRLLAQTSTPARFVSELCPGIGDRIPSPLFMVEPGDSAAVRRVRDAIFELGSGKLPFRPREEHRLERDDANAEVVIIKDVHSLLAYPDIVAELPDWRAVVITRNCLRTLDSYFHGQAPQQRNYLVEDYKALPGIIAEATTGSPIAAALDSVSPRVIAYLRRPRFLTSEIYRQAAVSEFVAHTLRAWAAQDERVTHIEFEDLCSNPIDRTLRLYEFLDLEHADGTQEAIQRMTSGDRSGYYDTEKNSHAILAQPFRCLRAGTRERLASFLGGGR